jgi:hypothetical protein
MFGLFGIIRRRLGLMAVVVRRKDIHEGHRNDGPHQPSKHQHGKPHISRAA